MKTQLLILAAWAGFVLSGPIFAADTPVLILNDANAPPYTTADGKGFLDAVAGEAFRRVGISLRLVKLPPERGLINANAGIEDGELARIAGLDAEYPNLVRVPEKLGDWEFAAFSKNKTLPAQAQAFRSVSVGYIRGWKIYEKQYADLPSTVTAEEAPQLFRLLERDRVDVALYERWMGQSEIKRQGITNVYPLEPTLARREMFMYLNKRHADLVPKIAAALREIKAEGLYARLYREKVLSVGPGAAK